MHMRRSVRNTLSTLALFGFAPITTIKAIRGLPSYLADLANLRRQRTSSACAFRFGRPYPCLQDKHAASGKASGHYFHQDLLVARRIFSRNPETHVDVGSRVDGFVAHVAAFRSLCVLDIRQLRTTIPNVEFIQADVMGDIPDALVGCCDSLSCLHALEHFGLGRYGDPVRYDGYLAALDNLGKLLRSGGRLYLSVPIGPQRIEFNAHRVFSVAYLLELVGNDYTIDSVSYVDDRGNLHEDAALTDKTIATDFGCTYGCGILDLVKR